VNTKVNQPPTTFQPTVHRLPESRQNGGVPAIVVSAHTMALGVIRALGTAGVPIVVARYDPRDMAHLSKYVRDAIVVPHPEHDEAGFVEALLNQFSKYRGGLLIPAADEALAVVSRNKQLLQTRFRVAATDWTVTQRFIEKVQTYALAEAAGVPVPHTCIPQSLAEAGQLAAATSYPCLVKPSQGHLFWDHFRTKMFWVQNADELVAAYKRAAQIGLEVMLQEIIPGPDSHVVNYNAYVSDDHPPVEFTARHVRNAPPQFGSPRVVVSEHIPEVVGYGRAVLRAIGFAGYACVEFKQDCRTGRYVLMEINGRHNLSTALAVRCGINFPYLHYSHLTRNEVPTPQPFEDGVYWVDITRDAAYSVKHLLRERYLPWQYARPYISPHVHAILDCRDLRPFLQRCRYLATSLIPRDQPTTTDTRTSLPSVSKVSSSFHG